MKKLILLFLFFPLFSIGQSYSTDNDENISLKYWLIDGVERNAIVYTPENILQKNTALIFVWHGHGGSAERFLKRFPIHKFWSEAIVVFPQGLNSKSPRDINAERTGWQYQIGDYENRDIKFFDNMYSYFLNKYPVDINKVYCTGSSNGGSFTYMLLQSKPQIFSSAAPAITANIGYESIYKMNLPPIPIFHTTGKKEFSFLKQKELVDYIIKKKKAKFTGYWNNNIDIKHYKSQRGDIIWFTHSDGHRWRTEDTKLIADFFKDN